MSEVLLLFSVTQILKIIHETWVMSNDILNLIINVLLLAIAVYSILDVIYEKDTEGSFLQKINVRGYILITCAFLVIVVNFFKDGRTERELENYHTAKANIDSQLQRSQKENQFTKQIIFTSIICYRYYFEKVDSSYLNILKASNIAHEEYNLQYADPLHKDDDSINLNINNPNCP